MPIHDSLPEGLDEIDVVIAGGGTAGCIIASRLSDADPNLSILVIESGDDNYENPSIRNPLLFMGTLLPGSTTSAFYEGESEPALGGRQLVVPTGNVLGGGSSVNIMMYTRPQGSDLDSWNMPGWTKDEMLPYFKKFETFSSLGAPGVHGNEGPIQISRGTYNAQASEDDFVDAAALINFSELDDLQDFKSVDGFQRANRFVGLDGRRQDVAHGYLHPRLRDGKHPNLHIILRSKVVRVLTQGKTAVGVEFVSGGEEQQPMQSVKARQKVVLSCGTFGSPSVLERSGIGHPDVLSKAGIDLVASLPAVGNNYQDHQSINYSYRSALAPEETADALLSGRMKAEDLLETKSRMLGWNVQDISGKLRPTASEVAQLGPAFQAAWEDDFKSTPDKPLAILSLISAYPGDPSTVEPGQYLSVSAFSLYPYSRGSVHVKGKNLDDGVSFITGYLADSQGVDIKKHVWAYKKQREIMRRMKTYRGEVASSHPPFAQESGAAVGKFDGPLPGEVTDITYTEADDAVLEEFICATVGTTWHSLGTCKMAPRDQDGVVDADLSVYGIEGLKIADMSIVPANVGANTASTAMAIGEKAADILIAELGFNSTR